MDLDLKGKVILVPGGAKGIGAAIVRFCGNEGAIPVILANSTQLSIRKAAFTIRTAM